MVGFYRCLGTCTRNGIQLCARRWEQEQTSRLYLILLYRLLSDMTLHLQHEHTIIPQEKIANVCTPMYNYSEAGGRGGTMMCFI